MRSFKIFTLCLGGWLLCGCSPVKLPVTNQYQLNAFSTKQMTSHPKHVTLLVTTPEAVAGYQTEEMLYVKKPFQLEAFANNAWMAPPADMLFPLLVQSMQRTGYFYAVTSSPYGEKADYRLDTQVLALNQNFLKKPSVLEFNVKVVLTNIAQNRVTSSLIINQQIPCLADTPYAGVVAANQASRQFTAHVADFVISHIKG